MPGSCARSLVSTQRTSDQNRERRAGCDGAASAATVDRPSVRAAATCLAGDPQQHQRHAQQEHLSQQDRGRDGQSEPPARCPRMGTPCVEPRVAEAQRDVDHPQDHDQVERLGHQRGAVVDEVPIRRRRSARRRWRRAVRTRRRLMRQLRYGLQGRRRRPPARGAPPGAAARRPSRVLRSAGACTGSSNVPSARPPAWPATIPSPKLKPCPSITRMASV